MVDHDQFLASNQGEFTGIYSIMRMGRPVQTHLQFWNRAPVIVFESFLADQLPDSLK
jgi:hypothetical protein